MSKQPRRAHAGSRARSHGSEGPQHRFRYGVAVAILLVGSLIGLIAGIRLISTGSFALNQLVHATALGGVHGAAIYDVINAAPVEGVTAGRFSAHMNAGILAAQVAQRTTSPAEAVSMTEQSRRGDPSNALTRWSAAWVAATAARGNGKALADVVTDMLATLKQPPAFQRYDSYDVELHRRAVTVLSRYYRVSPATLNRLATRAYSTHGVYRYVSMPALVDWCFAAQDELRRGGRDGVASELHHELLKLQAGAIRDNEFASPLLLHADMVARICDHAAALHDGSMDFAAMADEARRFRHDLRSAMEREGIDPIDMSLLPEPGHYAAAWAAFVCGIGALTGSWLLAGMLMARLVWHAMIRRIPSPAGELSRRSVVAAVIAAVAVLGPVVIAAPMAVTRVLSDGRMESTAWPWLLVLTVSAAVLLAGHVFSRTVWSGAAAVDGRAKLVWCVAAAAFTALCGFGFVPVLALTRLSHAARGWPLVGGMEALIGIPAIVQAAIWLGVLAGLATTVQMLMKKCPSVAPSPPLHVTAAATLVGLSAVVASFSAWRVDVHRDAFEEAVLSRTRGVESLLGADWRRDYFEQLQRLIEAPRR